MDMKKTQLTTSSKSTAVLVTNQFQCERLIQAGRSVADISKTDLIVLNVQSNEYPANPEAIQYLFNISTQNGAMMNVMYAQDTFKTIVQYIKDNKTAYVVTGMPQTKNSILHRITLQLQQRYPDLPVFLFGHSMGSMIARLYLSKYSSLLRGVVLCGTAGPNPASKAGMLLCRKIIASKGPMAHSVQLYKLIFGSYNRRYDHPKTEFAWLSRDDEMVNAYIADPLCGFEFTASAYLDLLCLQYYCNTRLWYKTLDQNLPMLMISGSMDPVGNYGKGIMQIERQLTKAGIHDLTVWLYPQARHELLNETNRDEVMRDVLSWFALHL